MLDSLFALAPTLMLAARPLYAFVITVMPSHWLCHALPRHICPR